MEVWLKHLTVLLFTVEVAVLVASGQQTVVVGDQESESVAFGSNVTLDCVLNAEVKKHRYERVRVTWYFNQNRSSLDGADSLKDKVFNNSSTSKTHLLTNVTDEDSSGWYFCRVTSEIPFHSVNTSNGTKILVSQRSEYTTNPSLMSKPVPPAAELPLAWWVWVVLGVSAFILIVLLITYTLLRWRCINSAADDPIYANTRPKQPSPRPGAQVDTLKIVSSSSSSSSSQNLRTPNNGRRYEEGKRRQKL